ncbi:MAG: 50S ribosomal protein L3, partial [Phycisphaerae bacterium]|nr:50S ribosomal protein L3 [Phycisphaerae bacterium]
AGTGRGIKKGKKMTGRLGSDRVTSKNHRLLKIDPENNILLVSGSVPGRNGAYIVVERARNQ